jgi:phospholipid/cholesterol/gamma-HCH transport system substrate-binding protein
MRIPAAALPKVRLGIVLTFLLACLVVFLSLWTRMGGQLGPLTDGYRLTASMSDVQNLSYDSDVRMAGVLAGKVRGLETEGGAARLVLQLQDDVAPLHEGATLRLRSKTLIEESYLEVVDGTGPELPDGAALPAAAELPSVQLDDVLRTLDEPTRAALQSAVQSMAPGTDGRTQDIRASLVGLGNVGREGRTVMEALAAQSEDLTALSRETSVLLSALDGGQGDLARLVTSAQQLSSVTSARAADVEASVRRLPDVTGAALDATGDLQRLTNSLAPVAADLRAAAPDLDAALVELPATAAELRASLPSVQQVLDRAPATLDRAPRLADDGRRMVPHARVALADVNPMLAYLQPYGADLGAFFANVAGQFRQSDANGHFLRAFVIANEQSARSLPYATNTGSLDKSNAYPAPGQAAKPGPFDGTYTRVVEEPK